MGNSFSRYGLWLTGLFFLAPPSSAALCKVSGAYYAEWTKYAGYDYTDLPYNKLTHIFHAFVIPNADGSLNIPGGFVEAGLVTNAHAAGGKVILSVGGAGGSANFGALAGSAAARTAFANNVKNFIIANNYDGVDFDWEFPQNATDRTNFNVLVQTLRNTFDAAPAHPEYLITGAYSWTSYYGQWYDLNFLKDYVDLFNIMVYDYHGPWSSHSGHNGPLGAAAGDPDGAVSGQATITYYNVTRGVPLNQLVYGLAFYGYDFPVEAIHNSCGGGCGAAVGRAYKDFYTWIGAGWTRTYDAVPASPYIRHDSQARILLYDDAQSIQAKSNWAVNTANLAGVFMWEVSQDQIAPGNQPLLDAMIQPFSCGSPTFSPTPTSTATPHPVPGRIQAEDYHSHYDTTVGNQGGVYRTDNVDIEACTDTGGGFNVGWTVAGEWLEYNLSIAAAGTYDFTLRVASANATPMSLQMQLDGANLGGAVSIPNTGGWTIWANVLVPGLSLPAGNHVLRLALTTGNYNLNYIDILAATPATPTRTRTRTPSPTLTLTGTPSRTASQTLSRSPSPSSTRSGTASFSPTPSSSLTSSLTPTRSPIPSSSSTPTSTVSGTLTASGTISPTLTPPPPGSTETGTPTEAPTFTATPSLSPSSSLSGTPSLTASPVSSPSLTPTPAGSATLSSSPSATATGSPSATPSPQASPTSSGSPSGTLSPSPAFSPSATASPSPQASPTQDAGQGPLEIEACLPLPNPNATALHFKLSGQASSAEARIYTAGYGLAARAQAGALAKGWNRLDLPCELLCGLGNGTYFYVLEAQRAGEGKIKPAKGTLVLIR